MIGLGAASLVGSEIDSLMRHAKAAMTTINQTPMSDGARAGAIASYNQLLTDAEVMRALVGLNTLDPDDFRMFKADVQGFLAFGVMEPASPAPEVSRPVVTQRPAVVADVTSNYLIWGGAIAGVAALAGVAMYGSKKGWFKGRRRR